MRIVAIRGKNLASLKGEFQIELDQPPLSNLGLFSIHGPVGAGKSTLLDALCLGLFGRTPRLSGSGGAPLVRGDDDVDQLKSNAPATLVRRGANDAYAEVDFVGKDGALYRARWDIRRGRVPKTAKPGTQGRLQPEQQTLKALARPGDVDPVSGEAKADVMLGDTNSEVRRLVEDRLGLSFDELCRSVLLAQGGFQSFLSAKPAERAELLEKVTGTAIYSRLSIAAHERARAVDKGLATLRDRLAAAVVLDDDARMVLERRVVEAKSLAATSEATISALQRRRDQQLARAGVKAADGAVADARARAVAADVCAQDAIAERDERRAAYAALSPLFVELRRAHAAAQLPTKRADEARRAADDAEANVVAAEANRVAADAKVEAVRAEIAGDADSDDDVSVAALDAAARAVADAQNAATGVAGAVALCDAAARDVEAAAEAEARAAEAARVAASAFAAAIDGAMGAAAADVDGRDLDAELGAAAAGALEALDAALGQAIVRADVELSAIGGVVARLEAAHDQAHADDALVEARRKLTDGEPCPVCGSAEHPLAHVDGAAQAAAIATQLRREREGLTALHHERAQLGVAQAAAQRRRQRATHLSTTPHQTPHGVGSNHLELARQLEALDDCGPLQSAWQKARRDADAAAADLAAASSAHVAQAMQLDAQRSSNARLADIALQACAAVGVEIGADTMADPTGLKRVVKALRARLVSAQGREARRARLEAALAEAVAFAQDAAARTADARRRRDDAALVKAERSAAADDAKAAVTAAEDAIARATADAGGGDDDAAFARAVKAADDDAEAAVIAQRKAALALATAEAQRRERRERLDRLGGNVDDDDDDVAAIDRAIEDAKSAGEAARDAAATTRAQLLHDDERRLERDHLAAQLAQTERDGETWLQLGQLIGAADGGRFRQFAQGLTLDALVTHANHHLAVLQPRYRLRRTQAELQKHDLDLVIVDSEAGGDVRSTQTLSGGETFLVSLALALGLSSLSANEGARGRVESLFIDEGFSALDQETLDTALAAFDALRQTGRQIGVISHVPLLVERLGAQVRVVPMGGGASRVEVHAS